MHLSDHNPEFLESSSSSPEATPPDRNEELSESAHTYNRQAIGPDHTVPGQDVPPLASSSQPLQPLPERRFLRTAPYLAVAGALIVALLLGGLGGWLLGIRNLGANSTNTSNSPLQEQTEKAAAKVHTAVVQINVQKSPTESEIGSGVLIDRRGYIVTNNHVIEGGQNINVVLYNGSTLPAQLTGTDPADDLAVIQITPPKNIAVATLGDSSKLKVGQSVLAIGNPLGVTQTVTGGIVSALGRVIPEGTSGAIIINAVQTDAAINPGNSGGALVDMQGNLVGIPTLVLIDPAFNSPANGVGFAIPSNRVKFIVPQLIESGRVIHSGRADLGVQVISVNPSIAAQNQLAVDKGALIVRVIPNSPAEQAGLKRGDIIVQVDNTTLDSAEQLLDVIIRKDVGQTVSLKIYRGSQQLTVKVQLGELQVKNSIP